MFIAAAVVLFIAAEFVIGWWALPVVGFVLGLVGARKPLAPVIIAGAALTAWTALFAWTSFYGGLPAFIQGLAGSMQLKTGQLLSAGAALPALLAGPSAQLGVALRNAVQPVPVAEVAKGA